MFERQKEKRNAEQVAKILPYSIYYDMEYHFARNKQPKGFQKQDKRYSMFASAFVNQLFVEQAINLEAYQKRNPLNQVLSHGIVYKALFDMYMRYTTKTFDTIYLLMEQMNYKNDKVIISLSEYESLPKKYRDIFLKYKQAKYILNISYNDMVISYANKDKFKLEQLLNDARSFIPYIYREPEPDIDFGGTLKIYEHPNFYPDLAYAKRVSDTQLNAIRKLHDIFVEISKITLPCLTLTERKQKIRPNVIERKDSARDIYNEYLQECAQKNVVYNAHQEYKKIKRHIIKNVPSLPAKTVRGKEVIKTKEIKLLLKKHNQLPYYLTTTAGQKCKSEHDFILSELKKKLETYTR